MAKKVLIVDDSALVRKQLKEIISTLEMDIDFAKNGKEAVDKAAFTNYDVITMDINMPVMDGLEAVEIIMKENPTAILMVSSLTTENAVITMDALDLGAIDFIPKPGTMNIGRAENTEDILQKVKSLSRIPKRRLVNRRVVTPRRERRQAPRGPVELVGDSRDIIKLVLIGASTGGPGLIEEICSSLPANYQHPICIVQHMPAQFTASFAKRLDRTCKLPVVETVNNMEVKPGNVYVARGGVHLNFAKKTSGKIVFREDKDKGSNYFQPSANDMMKSALDVFRGTKVVGVLLTGIGDDGADGMVALKKSGAYTLGESEESATVYGMPKEAFDRGGVTEQLNFKNILKKIATLK